ncbi:MAG: type II toxin-antitoxin system Phd/YefM family antitoxin [Armatimonadetes bacterium]|nr:type II toxin-antitoxin system Phd/YefM family antitoxin [Armatimonadota bacterium]
MTTLSVSKLRADLADAINRVAYRKERVIVERQGKRLVALVPVEELEWLEEMEDRWLLEAADEALREEGERVPWEQVKREAGLS